jgi:hypothetical protein
MLVGCCAAGGDPLLSASECRCVPFSSIRTKLESGLLLLSLLAEAGEVLEKITIEVKARTARAPAAVSSFFLILFIGGALVTYQEAVKSLGRLRPSLTRVMWLPRCRTICQPSLAKISMISRPLSVGGTGIRRDFQLLGLDGEWHAAICPHFEKGRDWFTDVRQSFLPRLSLAAATGDGWAFGDPDSVFVAFKCVEKSHLDEATLHFRFGKTQFFRGLEDDKLALSVRPNDLGVLSKNVRKRALRHERMME